MEVYNRENISLDPSKISKNPRERALAKLMINSFWGKFGQRNNMDLKNILNS
uniref:DNA-directed DNA polymerase n=1 Tax=Romanomermis culicivorax TaxID=13658 RepID=A0A915K4H0_ROMCU